MSKYEFTQKMGVLAQEIANYQKRIGELEMAQFYQFAADGFIAKYHFMSAYEAALPITDEQMKILKTYELKVRSLKCQS